MYCEQYIPYLLYSRYWPSSERYHFAIFYPVVEVGPKQVSTSTSIKGKIGKLKENKTTTDEEQNKEKINNY